MKLSENASSLVEGFAIASNNYDKMRGWERSLTVYCQKKEFETGSPASRFRAAIKASLTRRYGVNATIGL